MFICAITKKISERGEACKKIVIKRRPRVYKRNIFNEETGVWEKLEVGTGWEIIKEVNATAEGVRIWNELSDEERELAAKDLLK